jgi:hypothetical protein
VPTLEEGKRALETLRRVLVPFAVPTAGGDVAAAVLDECA